ncbi:MAG: DUF4416 family protein [candidate division KSB1 bacterium]|jgi:hypothetical protein|nr:DUF4416 family protein [candidate division KSB1 bacterium]
MGHVQPAHDVKLFTALMFGEDDVYYRVKEILISELGSVDYESEIFDFRFTDYYEDEMGTELRKTFISFENLILPERLIDIKLRTNEIEAQFLVNGNRRINIDPGYLTDANIVLATTKNFSHRIYLGKGIYGDLHLIYKNRAFHPLEWTYPDYQSPAATAFFLRIKNIYHHLIR